MNNNFDQSKQFKRWTPEEEKTLLEEIKNNEPIYIISKKHDRSKKAIELRLLDMAIKMVGNGIPYEEIEISTKCTKSQINERIKEKENINTQNTYTSKEPIPLTILQELKAMNEKLTLLTSQQKSIMNTLSKEV